MTKPVDHQFGLFGFIKPTSKVPISAERIREAKKKYANGDVKGSAALIREVGEKLDAYYERKFGKK